MPGDDALELVILDEAWRPRRRLPLTEDWRAMTAQLLADDCRWLAIRQRRDPGDPPAPRPADIHLTRTLLRRLRPLEMTLADHVIQAGQARFSFRAAGLL